MAEKNIDLNLQRSKGLDDLPALRWDYVVTMGCGDACPHLPARHRLDWNLPDPKHLDDSGFRAVRDRIEGLVRDLIAPATKRLNFFENYLTLWVALCMVVGVLVEAPVMLTVCAFCNRTRHWFPAPTASQDLS